MRFAFRASPEYTSWAELPDLWKEADDIELWSQAGYSITLPERGADWTLPRIVDGLADALAPPH